MGSKNDFYDIIIQDSSKHKTDLGELHIFSQKLEEIILSDTKTTNMSEDMPLFLCCADAITKSR